MQGYADDQKADQKSNISRVKIAWVQVIFGVKHPRIWVPPTQFQKFNENFLIGFPGNWTKILVPPESA